jgi:tRNA threonylcarbamoyladenosine biosynthesis protein TsaE
MMKRLRGTFTSSSPEETAAVARRLAGTLPDGSVVALVGPLGTGKTVFVKGLAAGMELPAESVTSPTFTLINEYGGPRPLVHVDLYRLTGQDEIGDLGLQEYFDGPGVVAVEWAERAGFLLPEETITATFERLGPRRRRITITGRSDRGRRLS